MMRDFIIYANKPLQPGFPLNDLPGSGRADLLARCVNSALWLSHGVRRDTSVHLSVEVNKQRLMVTFSGEKMKRVSPDERSIASWIKKALDRFLEGEERVQEGITVQKLNLPDFLKRFKGRDIIILKEGGRDIRVTELKEPVFVLGDHLDLPENLLESLNKFNPKKVSLGPESLLASHAIILAHGKMDRRN
jgi:tRNA (pseudouridine54-N1)-methyltransferase